MTTPVAPSIATPAAAPPAGASFPEVYERVLVGPLFRPSASRLLDRVPLPAGARVLDVACGTGIVARLARERLDGQGHVVGIDRNPAMLAVARAVEPAIEWREGDAAALPVRAAERFDVVLCSQALQFLADRPAAVRAMHRVLAPGGHVGIGVWRSLEEHALFHELALVAERFLGPVEDTRHGFADADALVDLLRDAGFADVRVEPVWQETRFEGDPILLVRLNAMTTIGMTASGRAMPEAERAAMASRIVEASRPVVARYEDRGALAFRTSANIATARA